MRAEADPTASFGRDDARWLVIVLAVVALAYARVATAGWIWDDLSLIQRNVMLNPPQLLQMLGQDMWCCDPALRSGYYRPVLMISLAADRWLFGDAAAPAHLHSLALHLGCVAALYGVLRSSVSARASAVGALIAGLHPLPSEAVAWVSARSDLLAALFSLLAIHAAQRRRGVELAAWSALAVLSKESAALLPAMAWCWLRGTGASLVEPTSSAVSPDRALERRKTDADAEARPAERRHRRRGVGLAALVPSAVGIAAALSLRLVVDLVPGVVGGLSPGLNPVSALGLAARGLALLVAPWPLTGTASLSLPTPGVGAWVGAGVAIAGIAWLCRGRERWLVAAAGLALLPALVTLLTRATLGERYFYLPMVGLAAAIATRVDRSSPPNLVRGAAAVAMLGAIVALQVRLADWGDNPTFFRAAVARAPDAYSLALLGDALWTDKQPAEALAALEASLAAVPRRHLACLHLPDVAGEALGAAAYDAHAAGWRAAGCDGVAGFSEHVAAARPR